MRTNTMPTIGFDTLKFVKTLVNAGMPPSQAEALAKEQNELVSYQFDQLATKSDIEYVQAEIKHLEDKIDAKFQNMQADLEIRLARLQLQLMLTFFGGLTTAVGIVLGVIKLML